MNAKVDELAFLEERRKYLGGSDIAALLGIAPKTWSRHSPLSLYLDKREPPKPEQARLRKGVLRRGKRWESVVAEMLVEELESKGHKVEVIAGNKRYIDPDFPHFACEIDYEIRLDDEPEITNVELKTVHPFAAHEWGESGYDDGPVWYTAQCHWGLGITQKFGPRKRCLLAPLFGADEIRTYPILPALDLITDIRATADKFWHEHVLAGVPPPPGGLVDLAKLFPKDVGITIETEDLAVIDAIAELRELQETLKAGEKRWGELEYIVKKAMGEASMLTIGNLPAATWKHQEPMLFNQSTFKEAHPALYEQFKRPSPRRVFQVKTPKAPKEKKR